MTPTQAHCSLYFYYNGDAEIIYIGVSINAIIRLSQHRLCSQWFNEIKSIKIFHHDTRQAALQAERDEVERHNPKYNVLLKKKSNNNQYDERSVSLAANEKNKITYKICSLDPVYTLSEASVLLGLSRVQLKKMAYAGEIASFNHPYKIETSGNPVKLISGWQILEYLEHLGGFAQEK